MQKEYNLMDHFNHSIKQLNQIRKVYNLIWIQLKKKYPEANAYLVFAFEGEFGPINAEPAEILKKNPNLYLDCDAKQFALSLLDTVKKMNQVDLDLLLDGVPLNPDCRVEIIWNDLNFDLIYQIQKDHLVDHSLTPQTKASIRIVLGTLNFECSNQSLD